MGLISEFREFAMKGNVIDLAVGVIIGAAFGNVTNSMVKDIMMPPIGSVMGKLDFSNMYFSLSDAVDKANAHRAATQPTTEGITNMISAGSRLSLAQAQALGPVIAYGNFITQIINFIIVAICVFIVIKLMNTAKRRFEKQQEAGTAPLTLDQQLLTEIRDSLKGKDA
jgi:large conductance mechanosensitive channel